MEDQILGAGMVQIGIDSFAAAISAPATGLKLGPVERMQRLLEEIELADQVGRVLSRVFAAIAAGVEWHDSSRKLNLSASFHTETRDKRQLGLLRSWSHEEGARVRRMRRFEHKVRYVGEKRMDLARSALS
jgi:hypothetical protein